MNLVQWGERFDLHALLTLLKNESTLHSNRKNVTCTLKQTKYTDARKTIYSKRYITLNDECSLETLECTQNINVSKRLIHYPWI
jgi:hypothetical protein